MPTPHLLDLLVLCLFLFLFPMFWCSYNSYNVDATDDRYGGRNGYSTGMYEPGSGLGNALLCFTGPEYMHMVLRLVVTTFIRLVHMVRMCVDPSMCTYTS